MPGNHQALKAAILAARAEAGYKSNKALAKDAGVHVQTLENWMSGKTTPRAHELSIFARFLGKPQDYFAAIYEDRAPERPLHEMTAELIDVVRELVFEIRAERAKGALHPTNGGAPASTERPVPDGTRG